MKRKTKICPGAECGELPIKKFGFDYSQPDGRNLRCRACVASRMRDRRAAQRDGRLPATRRRPRKPTPPGAPFVMLAAGHDEVNRFVPLVLGAIDHAGGVCSQRQIVTFAREQLLPTRVVPTEVQHHVGLALGELFQRREIATRGEADTRVYFRRVAISSWVRRW